MNDRTPCATPLPTVLHVGFGGSRRLLEGPVSQAVNIGDFEAEIEHWLVNRIEGLKRDLGVDSRRRLCGISSLAAGADTLFGRACRAAGIPQRVFLPQMLDDFLNAMGSDGADFSAAEAEAARAVLSSPHIIELSIASDSVKRNKRFEDVNRQIVRVSDVVMCLVGQGSRGGPGGTEDLIGRTIGTGKPVLVIAVTVKHGSPVFSERWHGLPPRQAIR